MQILFAITISSCALLCNVSCIGCFDIGGEFDDVHRVCGVSSARRGQAARHPLPVGRLLRVVESVNQRCRDVSRRTTTGARYMCGESYQSD